MKYLLFGSVFLSFGFQSLAQQLPYLRTEVYSPQWHNPASYGTWNKLSVNTVGQAVWLVPEYKMGSFVLTGEGFSAFKNQNSGIGFGGKVMYDYSAFHHSYSANLAANYQLDLGELRMAIGIAPGLTTMVMPGPSWLVSDTLDPTIPTGTQTKFKLDAGVYFFNDKFYAGFSIAQVNGPGYSELNFGSAPHYFVNAGYRFKVSKNIQLFPSLIFGSDGATSLLSGRILVQFFKPGISFGGGFESSRNIYGLAGYEYKNLSVMYAIGYNNSYLANVTYSTHELRFTYKIRRKEKCSTCEHF